MGPRPSAAHTNVIAIISLVLGVLSLAGTCFTGVPAVVCGHWALAQIRAEAGKQKGVSVARIGLVFGYVGIIVAIWLAISWIVGRLHMSEQNRVDTP